MSHWPVAILKSEDSSHTNHCGFPAAVRSRPLPVDLAGRLDATLSLSTMVEQSAWNGIQLPVA